MKNLKLNSVSKRLKFIFSLHKSLPLIWRLIWDNRVSKGAKALFVLGIIYLIAPFDFIPDIVLPFGLTDDFTIIIFLFERFLNSIPTYILEEYLSKY